MGQRRRRRLAGGTAGQEEGKGDQRQSQAEQHEGPEGAAVGEEAADDGRDHRRDGDTGRVDAERPAPFPSGWEQVAHDHDAEAEHSRGADALDGPQDDQRPERPHEEPGEAGHSEDGEAGDGDQAAAAQVGEVADRHGEEYAGDGHRALDEPDGTPGHPQLHGQVGQSRSDDAEREDPEAGDRHDDWQDPAAGEVSHPGFPSPLRPGSGRAGGHRELPRR